MLTFLGSIPLAGLMLAVALGYLLGRLTWRGLSLGPAGGTLLIALLLGRLGLHLKTGGDGTLLTVGGFGFALFIYSVGFEAGPRFFDSLRGAQGWRFILVGTLANLLALAVALAGSRLLQLNDSVTAGLLAGALTSLPTFAAASEVCSDSTSLSVSFAMIYPVGLAGIILLVHVLPRIMQDDLSLGAHPRDEGARRRDSPELTRAYRVQRSTAVNTTLEELALPRRLGCTVTRVHRGEQILVPDARTVLQEGDHLMVKGRLECLRSLEERIGPEIYDQQLRRELATPRAIQVLERDVIGRSLRELDLIRRFHCLVTAVQRGNVELPATPDLQVRRGDILEVTGRLEDIRQVARLLGRFERSSHETDIAVYAAGILLGLLLGRIALRGPGFDLTLGSAVGLLIMGVLLGRFRQIGPFSAHVPVAARQLVRDLGILLFVAETGMRAGASPMTGLSHLVVPILLTGIVATVLPVVGAVLFGRYVLRLRPVDVWGSVCGGMTSSAALLAIRRAADSNEPAISYAACFAVASVLVTAAGRIVVLLTV